MTILQPNLFLSRLIVQSKGERVYDEAFHFGVNIIRGVNSSGKSSVAEFIFYALGGELGQFKPEQALCDTVIAEVGLNGNLVTLRRFVDPEHPRQPVSIFHGPIEDATKSAIDGWQLYSSVRSQEKESFSQIMFRELQIPFLITEGENSITMHQILRVLYVDQLSRIESIMRDERFDTELLRLTVRDLLYGIYENGLYEAQMRIRELRHLVEQTKAEQRGLTEALSSSGLPTKRKQIEELESRVLGDRLKIDNQLAEAMAGGRSFASEFAAAELDLRMKLQEARSELKTFEEDENRLKIDISDSEAFLFTLQKRITALEESQHAEAA